MKRENFGSKIGVLAAAAGSAIGLGNIWKFPYITGKNGGAAFILIYLACIILIGIPLMTSEFVLGRKNQVNAVESFKKIAPNKPWYLTGKLAVFTSFIILSFYSIIAGWVFSYIGRSAVGTFSKGEAGKFGEYFNSFISSTGEPIFFTLLVIVITAFVVILGIKSGVEKYSKVLMPILFVLLAILIIRSLTLDGAYKGLEFLFKPDFSKLTPKGVLEALGHSFYSLSLGLGIIITYGSYVNKEENIFPLVIKITIADTLVALMAGIAIFPAVFSYGLEPTSGPGLIFITLPAVFSTMPLGDVFGTLFFILVGIASITSTISLMEGIVTFITEEFNIKRTKAVVFIALGAFLLAIPSSLSFGVMSDFKIFGKTFFDAIDFLTSNILLPLGGILVSIFVGWIWGTKNAVKEITSDGLYKFKFEAVYSFLIKYLAPIAITLILLYFTGIIKL